MDTQKDNKVFYLSAKIDKLAAAIYLVTSQLSDSEPLKWKLRELAVKTTILKDNWSFNLPKTLSSIVDLLNLGLNGGSVSVMNFTLLKNEYSALLEMVKQESQDNFKNSLALNHLEARKTNPVPTASPTGNNRPLNPSLNESKEGRQNLIIKAVRGQGWLPIKDIARAVPGCSVKTVQRELTELAEKGILMKKGDRRWSRYSLVA